MDNNGKSMYIHGTSMDAGECLINGACGYRLQSLVSLFCKVSWVSGHVGLPQIAGVCTGSICGDRLSGFCGNMWSSWHNAPAAHRSHWTKHVDIQNKSQICTICYRKSRLSKSRGAQPPHNPAQPPRFPRYRTSLKNM